MVYKIGNITDLATIPITDGKTFELLYRYTKVLSAEYGQERNADTNDGGFVLYCSHDTNEEDIKAYFDYTKHTLELAERYGDLISAMYLLNNEYMVTIVIEANDLPSYIAREIEEI